VVDEVRGLHEFVATWRRGSALRSQSGLMSSTRCRVRSARGVGVVVVTALKRKSEGDCARHVSGKKVSSQLTAQASQEGASSPCADACFVWTSVVLALLLPGEHGRTDGHQDRGDWSCDVACARRVCRRWSGEVTWARTWRVHRQRPAEAMWHARGGYGIGGLGSRCGARERAQMQQRRRLRGMVDEVRSLCRFIAMNVLVAVRRGEGGAGRAAVTVGADVVNTGRDAAAPAIVRTVRRLLWMPLLLLSIIPSWGCRCC
jgi:hypothetical protein